MRHCRTFLFVLLHDNEVISHKAIEQFSVVPLR